MMLFKSCTIKNANAMDTPLATLKKATSARTPYSRPQRLDHVPHPSSRPQPAPPVPRLIDQRIEWQLESQGAPAQQDGHHPLRVLLGLLLGHPPFGREWSWKVDAQPKGHGLSHQRCMC